MQQANMASIKEAEAEAAKAAAEKAAAEEAARKAAEEEAARKAAEEAAVKAREAAGQAADALPKAGFTYSDERAVEMKAALANLRDEKPEISMADKSKQILNAFGQEVGDFFSHSLPNGQEIMIPKGGIEESMLSALGAEAGASGNTYILDRIFFASGSSALDKQSSDQVGIIANIMKAYPDIKILLRGHTDSTGSASVNRKLSKARADSVMKALASGGIEASRMSTKGVGPAEPVESNDTADGRRMNRRIDISVI
jgi:outer membrane protein OmpA-like peptidoglycan-associated protein